MINSDTTDVMSVRQVATLFNTSRQNVFDLINRGRMNPPRKNTPRNDYQITTAMLAQLVQTQAKNIVTMLGAYLFTEILHNNKMISDEQYNHAKMQFKEMLEDARNIPALKDVIEEITIKLPALKD